MKRKLISQKWQSSKSLFAIMCVIRLATMPYAKELIKACKNKIPGIFGRGFWLSGFNEFGLESIVQSQVKNRSELTEMKSIIGHG